jgi:hypothetical protein
MFGWMRVLGARIRGWLSIRRVDEDFSQELQQHLEMLTEENLRQGGRSKKHDARQRCGWAE